MFLIQKIMIKFNTDKRHQANLLTLKREPMESKQKDIKPLTVPLWPHAGKALGIGKTAAYAAASRGDIPTIRIGGRILVPLAKLKKLVGED